jgi:hypothetical protein
VADVVGDVAGGPQLAHACARARRKAGAGRRLSAALPLPWQPPPGRWAPARPALWPRPPAAACRPCLPVRCGWREPRWRPRRGAVQTRARPGQARPGARVDPSCCERPSPRRCAAADPAPLAPPAPHLRPPAGTRSCPAATPPAGGRQAASAAWPPAPRVAVTVTVTVTVGERGARPPTASPRPPACGWHMTHTHRRPAPGAAHAFPHAAPLLQSTAERIAARAGAWPGRAHLQAARLHRAPPPDVPALLLVLRPQRRVGHPGEAPERPVGKVAPGQAPQEGGRALAPVQPAGGVVHLPASGARAGGQGLALPVRGTGISGGCAGSGLQGVQGCRGAGVLGAGVQGSWGVCPAPGAEFAPRHEGRDARCVLAVRAEALHRGAGRLAASAALVVTAAAG